MKTLDEVIKAFECCNHDDRCEDCPYKGISCTLERDTDALHYLKTIETTESLYHNTVNELSKWKDEDWKDRYLPLTWDELKQMEGKPIWMEFTYHNPEETYKYWTIVKYFDNDEGGAKMITGTGVYHKCVIDTDWQAYRKETT